MRGLKMICEYLRAREAECDKLSSVNADERGSSSHGMRGLRFDIECKWEVGVGRGL